MPILRKVCKLVAVAVAATLLASCGSSSELAPTGAEAAAEWGAVVDRHVGNAERAMRLKLLGREMFAARAVFRQQMTELSVGAEELNANYDASKAASDALLSDYAEQRRVALQKYRDIIFAMRKEVTPAEWQALMK